MKSFFLVLFLFLLGLFLFSFVNVSASTYSTYQGSVSQTAYFSGIVQKFDSDVHYVCFRSGQYSYVLAYSDSLVLDGFQFKGNVSICTYNSNVTSNNYSYTTDSSFLLNIDGDFIYSDLGSFPVLTSDRSDSNDDLIGAIIFAIVVAVSLVFFNALSRGFGK